MKYFALKSIIMLFLISLILACSKEDEDPFQKDSGVFTDQRDQKQYNWTRIGQLIWMAENLEYDKGTQSWAYDDDESKVDSLGRLYPWLTALTSCPAGWHLPTDQEWELLALYVSIKKGPYDQGVAGTWFHLGSHLKATSGWINNDNGTDDFGFTGLPGGIHFDNEFGYIGEFGGWWSSTEKTATDGWVRGLLNYHSDFVKYYYPKEHGLSVRCVKD